MIRNSSTVNLNSVVITGNNSGQTGGGVYTANGVLNVTDAEISGNSAGSGGSIGGSDSTINITRSVLKNNTISGNGGGVSLVSGTLSISNSTISGNFTTSGGGVSLSTSQFTITSSTISDNFAGDRGGGIGIINGSGTISNCTISGNSATFFGGGGIYASTNGPITLTNSTIVNNIADSDNNGSGEGGGINASVNVFNIRNTIVANNTGVAGPDIRGGLIISQGYNLIKDVSGMTLSGTTTGNITGQDPLLGPLQNNGGATFTRALLTGSPALDAGDPANFSTFDQRGVLRPLDGDLNGSSLPDIGAFEAGAKVVTKTGRHQ